MFYSDAFDERIPHDRETSDCSHPLTQKKTPVLFAQAFPWPRYRAPMNDFSFASASGAGFRAANLKYRAPSGISKSFA
jgi:hypothetical protein